MNDAKRPRHAARAALALPALAFGAVLLLAACGDGEWANFEGGDDGGLGGMFDGGGYGGYGGMGMGMPYFGGGMPFYGGGDGGFGGDDDD